jgi:hypothetical protein
MVLVRALGGGEQLVGHLWLLGKPEGEPTGADPFLAFLLNPNAN